MKNLKKLLSAVLSIVIISTMFEVPVKADEGKTISPTEATVIGNSSFAWNEAASDHHESSVGYDGTVSFHGWGNNVREGVITLNVGETGTYTFDVNAVIDLNLEGASPMSFKIDGGEYTKLTVSNATVSSLETAKSINGWTVKKISYYGDVLLEKGTHTLTFQIPRRKAGDAVIYAFDCATIKPTNHLATIKSDENTTIGNSSFTWSEVTYDMKSNANGYDGTVSVKDWGGSPRTGVASIYVEKSGTYSLAMNAVCDLTLDGSSSISFKVDNGSETKLTKSNTTVSSLANPWNAREASGWEVKNIAYTGEFLLEKGLHTFTFVIPRRAAGDAVIYAFDCATIIPKDIIEENELILVKADEDTTIGNSSFVWNETGDKKEHTNGYDGTISMATWGKNIRNGVVTLNVEKTGTYSFDVNAVIDLNLDGASPMSFKIDDGAETKLTTSNTTISDLNPSWTAREGWTVKKISYKGEFVLEEGTHTLTLIIPRRTAGDAVIYAFDCATIVPKSAPEEQEPIAVKGDEDTVIGNSSFVWNEADYDMNKHTNGYDGTISMATWGSNIRNGVVTLNVEKTGTYALDVNAVINLTKDGASPMSFKIDDGAETKLTASNTTISDLNPSWTARDGWTVKKISYTDDVVLEEGTHTLTFIIPRRTAGDAVIYAFDCATIKPRDTLVTVSKAGATILGNSTFTWNHSAKSNSDAAYDGTYTKFEGGGATITATKSFYVEEEYEYELEVYAASSATHQALSNLEFKIDNGPSTVLKSSNSTVSELANPCRTDAPWTTKSIEYNQNVVLSKGTHTITFTIPQNSNGRTEAYFVFDCATIRPTDNSLKISEFEYDAAMAVGMTTQIVVKDGRGTVITPDMVDSITFVSSSETVAKVDATGLVEALSEGTTRITVTIKENASSKPITQTADISVSELLISGFAIEGKIIPNNTICAKATVGDFSEEGEKMLLALAMYRGERLEEVQVDSKVCGENTNYSVSITLPENLDNCSVKAFLWDSNMSGTYLKADPLTNPTDFVIDINEDREPVILHISDPQIIDVKQERDPNRLYSDSESYWGSFEKMEENCFSYIRETVEETNPDLILITGDIVYGEFDDNGTSLQKFIEFMETLNTPWAPIFGNHDNESNMGADWQCAQLEAAENCMFKQRTLTGNGNYSIGIKQNGKLNRVIFMLDSNGCSVMSQATKQNGHSKSSAGFGNDQIAWYTENASLIKEYYEDVKFTFAFHIQTNKFATAYEKYGYSNGTPINIDYHDNKEDTDFGIIGAKLKGAWDTDDSITNGMIALGADSILVGHEHANSASVVYEGVRYQYGQKCSVYDRNNYVAADGTIVYSSYSDAGDPIMGGTVMKLSKTDGSISDAYIYYCDTSDDAGEGGGVYCPTSGK